MSRVRTPVECMFGELAGYFAHIDFKQNQEIGLSEARTMWKYCIVSQSFIDIYKHIYGTYTYQKYLAEYFTI